MAKLISGFIRYQMKNEGMGLRLLEAPEKNGIRQFL